MNELTVLVIEDEDDVRDALIRDLEPFAEVVRIEAAADVDDARATLAEITADGDRLGLVLADHRLPGETGVDFLVELEDERGPRARKVLVTGQADQTDTIRAVNEANLDHYIAKPWEPDDLRDVVRFELTEFVLAAGLPPLAYVRHLDGPRLLRAYSEPAPPTRSRSRLPSTHVAGAAGTVRCRDDGLRSPALGSLGRPGRGNPSRCVPSHRARCRRQRRGVAVVGR